MISENLTDYIRSMIDEENLLFSSLEMKSLQDHVPIIKPETKEFLKILILSKRPKRILEIGTATGFSALYMNRYQPDDGTVLTIERNEKRYEQAMENIKNFHKEQVVLPVLGDAQNVLKQLEGSFDFVFMDAAKGQYLYLLDQVVPLMSENAILVSDNIFQSGDVIKSRYAIKRRDRTIHKRMREYLYELKHRNNLETSLLSVGDGVAFTIKTSEEIL